MTSEPKIKMEHERQRYIFGITEFLSIKEKSNDLMGYYPKLFNLVIGLVRKNAEVRVDLSCEDNYETDSEEEDLDDFNLGDDEPEDIWE